MMQSPQIMQMMSPMAQQMMQNPQMMGQVQQMMQMMGGAAPPVGNPTQPAGPMDEAMQRARFGPQLSQLMAMGFDDEARCLAALLRCNGNVDSALDQLLS